VLIVDAGPCAFDTWQWKTAARKASTSRQATATRKASAPRKVTVTPAASSSRKDRHVTPNPEGGWDVKTPEAERASDHKYTQAEASHFPGRGNHPQHRRTDRHPQDRRHTRE